MPTQFEQVVNGGICTQKALGLVHRFELPHAPLYDSRWLMRQLGAIVRILRCIVNRSLDLHKYFINEERITKSLMISS
ncbi:MAG: hypothetical protein MK319_03565 [Pseudomonadales bacterium]|jgi:hypothetical protein|nr:hypothetical protein [Pseudomonadales bacterium]